MEFREDYPSPLLNLLAKELIGLINQELLLDLPVFGRLVFALRSSSFRQQRVLPAPFVETITSIYCGAPGVTINGRSYSRPDAWMSRADYDALDDMPGSFFSDFVHLSKLIHPRCNNWTAKDFAALPQSLKTLNVACCVRFSNACAKALPRELEALDISFSRNCNQKFVLDLPPTLLELVMPNISWLPSISADNDEGDFPWWKHLPQKLDTLEAQNVALPGAGLAHLPHSLLSLKIATNDLEDSHSVGLPPKLQVMAVSCSQPELTPQFFATLPQELEEFIFPSSIELSPEVIAKLPRSLKVLDLRFSTGLTDDCIAALPPRIEMFYCQGDSSLTDACAKNFPRSLRYITLNSNNITENCLPDLPDNVVFYAGSLQIAGGVVVRKRGNNAFNGFQFAPIFN